MRHEVYVDVWRRTRYRAALHMLDRARWRAAECGAVRERMQAATSAAATWRSQRMGKVRTVPRCSLDVLGPSAAAAG